MSGHERDGANPNLKKPATFTSYKLLVDPCLLKGTSKLYRFDGHVPEDPTYPTVHVRDPRSTLSISRIWNRLEGVELPIPKFKIDENYVGIPPPLEVTITNLNDNIDKVFLSELLQKHGTFDELSVYYHPTTKKHLGLARVVFESVKAAKACVEKLNNTPVMGKNLSVFTDSFGEKCKGIYDDLTTEKTVEQPKPDERTSAEAHAKSNSRVNSASRTKDNYSERGNLGYTRRPARNESSDSEFGTSSGQPSLGHGGARGLDTQRTVLPPKDKFGTGFDEYRPNKPCSTIGSGISQPYNAQNVRSGRSIPNASYPLPTKSAALETSQPRLDNESHETTDAAHKMDLDTRIKLLLKSKNSTPFGKFFGFEQSDSEPEDKADNSKVRQKRTSLCLSRSEIWDSESEEESTAEKKFAKKFKRNTFVPVAENRGNERMSPPPSPFLTHEDYAAWKRTNKNGLNNKFGTSDNGLDEVSDDSELPTPSRNLDDLTEDPSSIQLPPDPSPAEQIISETCPFPPTLALTPFYPNAQAFSQPLPNQVFHSGYMPYSPWGPSHSHSMQYPPPPVPFYAHSYPYTESIPPPPPEVVEVEEQKEDQGQHTRRIISAVFDRVIEELKSIMRRDFQRRLVETMAYKDFETWWLQKEQEDKDERATRVKYSQFKNQPPRTYDWQKNGTENISTDGSTTLGLGFRASIPKLPSFRRVLPTRAPSPVRVYEDSRKSLDESDLDDESEIEVRRQRTRRLSLSSESTMMSSSEDSTSDLESDASLSTSSSLQSIKTKTLLDKTEKEVRDDIASWVESISEEEAFSPIPSAPVEKRASPTKDLNLESSTQIEVVKDELIDVEQVDKMEIEEVRSTMPPGSPERVGPDGPYVHMHDHNYVIEKIETFKEEPVIKAIFEEVPAIKVKPKKERVRKKSAVQEKKKDAASFVARTKDQERDILTEFLNEGVDCEDLAYFQSCYEMMLADETQGYWLSGTHWVDHPVTRIPVKGKSKRVHSTGSARTEGFYKLNLEEKWKHKQQWANVGTVEYSAPGTSGAIGVTALTQDKSQGKTHTEKSREARSNQRRLLTALGNELDSSSDLLKFNQLKFRKKSLCFRRSCIHDWGLFAAEPIAADEMVIEYVGQTIRPYLADIRERKYEASGIGSSYLFRIDLENIIDATKCGNLSRFINHSCSPNCYAKIITIEGQKKIVIYSKQPIGVNEEITYDYKFPIEDQKIPCLCGTPQCRGTLN